MVSAVNTQLQKLPLVVSDNSDEQTKEVQCKNNNIGLENSPTHDKVDFKGNNGVSTNGVKLEATKGKKWGVGILSFIKPGSGQIANGQWGKGIAFLLGSTLAEWGAGLISGISILKMFSQGELPKRVPILAALSSLVLLLGPRVWGTVDAVKNANKGIKVAE